jgi:aubergine-like protein
LIVLVNPLLSIGKLHLWVMICPTYLLSKAESFYKLLRQVAAGMSMAVSVPYYHLISDDRQGTYVNEIENVLGQMNPQLLMCVVSNNRPERYTAIKKKCLVDRSGIRILNKHFLLFH